MRCQRTLGVLHSGLVLGYGGIPISAMRKLIVQQLSYDLTPVAGLSLVGACLGR